VQALAKSAISLNHKESKDRTPRADLSLPLKSSSHPKKLKTLLNLQSKIVKVNKMSHLKRRAGSKMESDLPLKVHLKRSLNKNMSRKSKFKLSIHRSSLIRRKHPHLKTIRAIKSPRVPSQGARRDLRVMKKSQVMWT
jgi:hypothetical protein